jgi:hypothetical protein
MAFLYPDLTLEPQLLLCTSDYKQQRLKAQFCVMLIHDLELVHYYEDDYWSDQVKERDMGRVCGTHEGEEECI